MELAEYKDAVMKFTELFRSEKAEYSYKAAERYCNVKSKLCIRQYLADRNLRAAKNAEVGKVIAELDAMLRMGETAERHNVLASAWKRKAMLNAGDRQYAALAKAANHYRMSWEMSESTYPYTGWIQIEGLLVCKGLRNWNESTGEASGGLCAAICSHD